LRLLGRESTALLGAALRLAVVGVRLRRHGFGRVIERAQAPMAAAPGAGAAAVLSRARRYAGLLESVSRVPFLRARCLQRSLALYLWLRGEGVASELCIGVRKEGRALRAHAWIELDGQVVNDDPAAVAAFTPLFSTGTDRARPDGATDVQTWSLAWS
jgi:hypothetical protein